MASTGAGRPHTINPGTAPAPARDWTAVYQHHSHEPPTIEDHTSVVDTSSTRGDCSRCRVTSTVRKYPVHFCGWEQWCCYKLSGEGAMLGKSFDHLPVCHSYCWKLERDRVEGEAKKAGNWPKAKFGLPTCHRECYMKALVKVQFPDTKMAERDVVPRNRSVKERLKIPKTQHHFARAGNADKKAT
ncbi:hypothetical protein LTR37_019001 [Vermiconidia calcicola]|uniref:Uncharacterized protein n=1 Tax=Vermiconidia calcicola TaxID=1690605 RepID=A0ACC3MIH4_9PEZI|nr:hypothetical protein LTR37_019001 [Vermiconidia calcicola]